MKFEAKLKYVRISAKKVRGVARALHGKMASEALDLVSAICRKSSRLISFVLRSALANAENNNGLPAGRLMVDSVLVEEGPAFKRFIPAARGSAHPIRKRTSHIRVILKEIEKKQG